MQTMPLEKKNSYPPINALVRGLALLAEVNRLGVAGVGALQKATGISKSTIVRNLETLEYTGFVARDRRRDGYVVTAKALSLSAGYDRGRRLIELATPILNEFRRTMPWPSDLALFDGESMVILETSRNPGALALSRPVGARLPLTESALGRAYLANIGPAERAAILDRLFGDTEHERRRRAALVAELDRYHAQGFAENDQSLSEHTRGVGVAVKVRAEVIACVNTIVLCEAMSMAEVAQRCVAPLRAVAGRIAEALAADHGQRPAQAGPAHAGPAGPGGG